MERMVVMGRVAAPFAVKGWIKVQPYTQTPEGLLAFAQWWFRAGDGWIERTVEDAAVHGRSVVAKVQGCSDRETAARLRGMEIAVPRAMLPGSADGEYYWADLQGLRVSNLQGETLGQVAQLLETGANPVLVVAGERERLIPFVDGVVAKVDVAQSEIVVDWGADF